MNDENKLEVLEKFQTFFNSSQCKSRISIDDILAFLDSERQTPTEASKNADTKQLIIADVSNRRELLIGLIRKDTNVTISGQFKGRLLGYRQESFLVTYNHNEQSEWISIDDITP